MNKLLFISGLFVLINLNYSLFFKNNNSYDSTLVSNDTINDLAILEINNSKFNESSLSVPLKEAREKFEKEYLSLQLKKFNGNISKTATFVGMERSALHRKLKGLGIKEFN